MYRTLKPLGLLLALPASRAGGRAVHPQTVLHIVGR